jgi:hypothetical protein
MTDVETEGSRRTEDLENLPDWPAAQVEYPRLIADIGQVLGPYPSRPTAVIPAINREGGVDQGEAALTVQPRLQDTGAICHSERVV